MKNYNKIQLYLFPSRILYFNIEFDYIHESGIRGENQNLLNKVVFDIMN